MKISGNKSDFVFLRDLDNITIFLITSNGHSPHTIGSEIVDYFIVNIDWDDITVSVFYQRNAPSHMMLALVYCQFPCNIKI